MRSLAGSVVVVALLGVSAITPAAQFDPLASARLVAAPPLTLSTLVDSNIPMVGSWATASGSRASSRMSAARGTASTYPQVAGLDPAAGTDKEAGRRARFFVHGRSDHYIDFLR